MGVVMKTRWVLLVVAGSACLLSTERTFADSVVYDNTATYLGTAVQAYLKDGNEVTLIGSGGVITGVDIAVEIAGETPVAVQAILKLYANDGPNDGSPGTLFWGSGFTNHEIEFGGPNFIHFAVPRVLVPSTFTWTAQLYGDSGTQVSFSQFYPPVVGSVRYGYWRTTFGPPWVFIEGVPPFGAKITADPDIPAVSHWSAIILMLALACASTAVIIRVNRRGSTGRTVGGPALLPVLGFLAWGSSALAQVQVGPQIRIDDGLGLAAAASFRRSS